MSGVSVDQHQVAAAVKPVIAAVEGPDAQRHAGDEAAAASVRQMIRGPVGGRAVHTPVRGVKTERFG